MQRSFFRQMLFSLAETKLSGPSSDQWKEDVIKQIPAALKTWAKLGSPRIRRKYICPINMSSMNVDRRLIDKLELTFLVGEAFETKLRPVIEIEIAQLGLSEEHALVATDALTLIGRTNIEEMWFLGKYIWDSEFYRHETPMCQAWIDKKTSLQWEEFISDILVFKGNFNLRPTYILDLRHTYENEECVDCAAMMSVASLYFHFPGKVTQEEYNSLFERREISRNDNFMNTIQFSLPISHDEDLVFQTRDKILRHAALEDILVPYYEPVKPRVKRKSFKKINNYKKGYQDSRFKFTEDDFKTAIQAWLSGLATPEGREVCLRRDPDRVFEGRLKACSEIAFKVASIIKPIQREYLSRRFIVNATPQARECLAALLELSSCTLEDSIGYSLHANFTVSDSELTHVASALKTAKEIFDRDEEAQSFLDSQESKWLKLSEMLLPLADSRQLIMLTFHFFPTKKINEDYQPLVDALWNAIRDFVGNASSESYSSHLARAFLDEAKEIRAIDSTKLGRFWRK